MSEFNQLEDKKTEEILIRKAKQLQDRPNRSMYMNMGIVAILGGIMIFPLLIGILLGGWLDEKYAISSFSWRLNLMIVGFFVGLYYAYRWVKLEGIDKIEKEYEKHKNCVLTTLFIEQSTGKRIKLLCCPQEETKLLKYKIMKLEGISMFQQKLLYSGKNMSNAKKIWEYGIKTNSNLNLTVINQGGIYLAC